MTESEWVIAALTFADVAQVEVEIASETSICCQELTNEEIGWGDLEEAP